MVFIIPRLLATGLVAIVVTLVMPPRAGVARSQAQVPRGLMMERVGAVCDGEKAGIKPGDVLLCG